MIKIYLANDSKQTMGGGWSFLSNLRKALEGKVKFVSKTEDCDVFFISGATMITRDTYNKAKELKKKIVVRVDGIPRNSRNRNTGTSRLFDYCQGANEVVYQSQWAREWIMPFVKRSGRVILNGVDTDIFKREGDKIDKQRETYLFVHFNRDENKRFPEASYVFQEKCRINRDSQLWLVGRFAEDLREYNFDFYEDEKIRYFGVVEEQEEMAKIMRSSDYLLYPSFFDACPNTLIEGLLCGCEPVGINKVGGMKEIIEKHKIGFDFSLNKMGKEYLELLNNIK